VFGVKSSVAHHLRRFAEEQGITISGLAEQLGVSRASLYSWLHEKRIPNARAMRIIADTLNVPVAELVRPDSDAISIAVSDDQNLDDGTVPEQFEIRFDPSIPAESVNDVLAALARYYRACGGLGLELDFELQELLIAEPEDALV
jgi:transcriptional regulator with XRE-family HTH domain